MASHSLVPSTPSNKHAVARFFWMFGAPVLLAFLALGVALSPAGVLAPIDLAYLAALSAMLFVRWREARVSDDPIDMAEPSALRSYLIGAAVIGLTFWLVAKASIV